MLLSSAYRANRSPRRSNSRSNSSSTILLSKGDSTPQTILQNAPFRGLGKRETVNPIDHFNLLLANFNMFDQRSYHVPFCLEIGLLKAPFNHLCKCLDLANHELKIPHTLLFLRQCGDLLIQVAKTFLRITQPRLKLRSLNKSVLIRVDQTSKAPFD